MVLESQMTSAVMEGKSATGWCHARADAHCSLRLERLQAQKYDSSILHHHISLVHVMPKAVQDMGIWSGWSYK